jgi:hypothetical protein
MAASTKSLVAWAKAQLMKQANQQFKAETRRLRRHNAQLRGRIAELVNQLQPEWNTRMNFDKALAELRVVTRERDLLAQAATAYLNEPTEENRLELLAATVPDGEQR